MKTLTTLLAGSALLVATPALAGNHSDGHMKKMKASTTMTNPAETADFAALDNDMNSQIDFAEFSNYMRQYGYTDAQLETEFVKLTNGQNTITDASFAGVNALMMKHKHMGDATHATMTTAQTGTQTYGTTMSTGKVMSNDKMMSNTMMSNGMTKTAGMVSSSDFASYDANRDGRVDFAEYSKWAKKDGLTTTAAANRFVKMTNGNSYLDEGTFVTAMSYDPTYYDTTTYMASPNYATVNGATYIGNTAVLGQSVDSNGNIILPQSDADTTVTTSTVIDSGATYTTGTTIGTMPSATVQPMYRPEDKVGGDLTQTNNPMMDVRPDTIDDETYLDARPDFTTPVE